MRTPGLSWIADSRSLHCRHCRYLHTPHCGLASGKEAWTHCGQYRNTLRSPQLRIADTAGTYTLHNADSTCIVTECGPPPLRTPRLHVADTAGTYTLHNEDSLAAGKVLRPHCAHRHSVLRTTLVPTYSATRTSRRARRPNPVAENSGNALRTPPLHIADTAGTYTLHNADLLAGRGGVDSLRTPRGRKSPPALRTPRLCIADNASTFVLRYAGLLGLRSLHAASPQGVRRHVSSTAPGKTSGELR